MAWDILKIWLEDLYNKAKEEHLATATHEHLCALGSTDNETASMHELNCDQHRKFAKLMDDLISELYVN